MSTLSWSTALSVSISSVNRENDEVTPRWAAAGSCPLPDVSGASDSGAGCSGAVGDVAGCFRPVSLSTRDISAPLSGEDGSQGQARAIGGRPGGAIGLATARDLRAQLA